MSSYMIRALPPGLIPRAKARARTDSTTLDAVLLRLLESYAERGAPGTAGAAARTHSLTPERRAAIAQQAAETRWRRHRDET
jgi:hypothetical protein